MWRTIDTAPKDGTNLFLYGFIAGELHGPSDEAEMAIGAYLFKGKSDYEGFEWTLEGGEYYTTWMKPTHWMPLPEPPK